MQIFICSMITYLNWIQHDNDKEVFLSIRYSIDRAFILPPFSLISLLKQELMRKESGKNIINLRKIGDAKIAHPVATPQMPACRNVTVKHYNFIYHSNITRLHISTS